MKYFIRLGSLTSILVMSLILASCSYHRTFYIINTSNDNCRLMVRLTIPVIEYESENQFRDSLPYIDDSGIRINGQTKKQLTKNLDYKIRDDYTIEINLPSSSTMFLGGKSSNDTWPYESITLTSEDKEIVFSGMEILEEFTSNEFFGMAMYYEFK